MISHLGLDVGKIAIDGLEGKTEEVYPHLFEAVHGNGGVASIVRILDITALTLLVMGNYLTTEPDSITLNWNTIDQWEHGILNSWPIRSQHYCINISAFWVFTNLLMLNVGKVALDGQERKAEEVCPDLLEAVHGEGGVAATVKILHIRQRQSTSWTQSSPSTHWSCFGLDCWYGDVNSWWSPSSLMFLWRVSSDASLWKSPLWPRVSSI